MHTAIIAKVEQIIEIPNADRVQIAVVLGEFCVVGKDTQVGDVGVLFPADLQLSEGYCRVNNLHRDKDMNEDSTKVGFFDKNRKVRCQKFLKVNSTAYFAQLESLYFTGVKEFNVMETFNDLNGHHICKRFESEAVKRSKVNVENNKSRKVSLVPDFHKHVDTDQFAHNAYRIQTGDLLSFHSKRHGTSGRYGYLPVIQELSGFKKFVNKFVSVFPTIQYEHVVGTRNVVLQNPEKEGFHGSESFRFEIMEQLKPFLNKGMTVYLEIVGFVNGRPIMPTHSVKELMSKAYTSKYGDEITYSYGCKEHEFKFFVYRITNLGVDGVAHEMGQKEMEQWCADRNIGCTLEVYPQTVYDGDIEKLKNLVSELTERPDSLTEDYSDPTHVSEGIIVRIDGSRGTSFMKSKSIPFKLMEGLMKVDTIEELS